MGDIFQDINFKRLKKNHWNFLSLLRKYSDQIEIVWVFGNHDVEIVDVMSHLVGIPVYEKYEWTHNDKKCCAIHGHQFDKSINNFYKVKNFFIELYLKIQKIKWLTKVVDTCVSFGESSLKDDVRNGAISYAKEHHYDIIFCGHTHIAEYYKEGNIEYYNTGCWTSDKGTMVTQNSSTTSYQFNCEDA